MNVEKSMGEQYVGFQPAKEENLYVDENFRRKEREMEL